MKRNIYCFAVLFMLFPFVLCGCSSEDEEKSVKILRLAETYKSDHVTTFADFEFARLVKEKSDGLIKIEVHTDGELGKKEDIPDKISNGEIDIARVGLGELGKGSDVLEKGELPFIFKSKGHMWRSLEQILGPKLDLELSLKNTKIIGYMDTGARSLYTTVPVEKPEDLDNLKIRTNTFSNYSADYFVSFGVINVRLDSEDDVTKAFEEKTIDGAEDSIINYYDSGHYKYAPNLLKIEYRYLPDMLVINNGVFSKLSPKEQDIITSAATEACAFQRENFEKKEKDTEEKLIAEGCKITVPSDTFKDVLLSVAEFTFKQLPRPDVEVSLLEQVRDMR